MIGHGGGRAGPHEEQWHDAGYRYNEIEPLRQELLTYNDIGKVQRAIRKLGIRIRRDIIQAVKDYNFDSQGIGFLYENYTAWRRLATGKGTIGDVSYLIHEIAEVEELQRVKRQTGFDFMKSEFKSIKELRRWERNFDRYYKLSHSKALEVEYEFIAQQVLNVTNGRVKISKLEAAATDPTRFIGDGTGDTEAWRYMFVDGIVMKKHHHFAAWCKPNEIVTLRKSAQRQLNYDHSKITLQNLIRHLKDIPID